MKLIEVQARLGLVTDGRWGWRSASALLQALRNDASLLNVELSPHFTLGEMLKSATAEARGLRNHPSPEQLLAMVLLCERILEPVRARWGPVRITSGFRIFSTGSQHALGEAADFEVTGVANLDVARWIVAGLVFDQLILEAWRAEDPNAGWIHASYRDGRARRSVLRTPTGGPPYSAGLPR